MELDRFQKIILAVLAGMLAFFSLLMIVFHTHSGVEFREGILRAGEQNGQTVYSGKVKSTPVTVTVSHPTNFRTVVDFTIGTEIHDVCEVEYPTERIQTERGETVNGIRVTKNGGVLFEGGYDPEDEFGWYGADGEWIIQAGGQAVIFGVGPDPWSGYETTTEQIVRFAFGPQSASRGHPGYFAMAVFLTLLLAADVVFHKELFRLHHWGARDPEPTEAYLSLERVGWVILTAVIAFVYVDAMVKIY